tara:strand:+ start:3351 stop:3515 length:165 start_codon:yes stop_codon:yes gene_type:complete
MSKYTPKQLKEMAAVALEARRKKDHKWLSIVMTLMLATGLNEHEITQKLQTLAQ